MSDGEAPTELPQPEPEGIPEVPAEVPEEEPKQPLLSLGVLEMDKRLGGGLPLNSLTLVEGDPDAGKSVVIQQLTCNALKEGFKAALFLLECSPTAFGSDDRSRAGPVNG